MAKIISILLLAIFSIRSLYVIDPISEITDSFEPTPVTVRYDDELWRESFFIGPTAPQYAIDLGGSPWEVDVSRAFLTVTVPDNRIDLEESPQISFTANFGVEFKYGEWLEGSYTYVRIIADGCRINDTADEYVKYYDRIHEDPKFERKYEYWGIPFLEEYRVKYSVSDYFEDFTIVFPDGECDGYVSFFFVDNFMHSEKPYNICRVDFAYAKNDDYVCFGENIRNARALLSDLTD